MAIPLPNKVISGAVTANPYAPRQDRTVVAYPFTEGAGTTIANTGLTTYTAWPAFDAPATRAGVIAWQSGDAVNDPSVACGNTGHIPIFTTGQGYSFPRGTFCVRFRLADIEAYNQHIFHDGGSGTGAMRIYKTGGAIPALVCSISPHSVGWGFEDVDWTAWHALVFRWSPDGYRAWLDNVESVDDDPTASQAWTPGNGQQFRFGGDGVNNSHLEISAGAFHDVALEDKEAYDLLDDPWLPWRHLPDKDDEIATQSGPIVGRMTTTGALVRAVSGYGGSQAGTGTKIRVQYGTTRNLGTAATSSAVTDPRKPIEVSLSSLSAGTLYYYRPEWTTDNGTTWQPFPRGLSTFRTQRSASAKFDFVVFADDHALATVKPAEDPQTTGFGVRAFKGTDSRKLYGSWCMARDIWLNTTPDFIVGLGDSWYCDKNAQAGTADYDQFHLKQLADWVDTHFYLFKTAGFYAVLGNHEGELGFNQNASVNDDVALQKQATLARKLFIPNPTNSTYSEGGENEGDPDTDGTLSWLPSTTEQARAKYTDYAGGYSGYLSDYVIDSLTPRVNTSPLGNYYALTWGDALFCFLDVNRYTEPGDPLTDVVGTGYYPNRPADQWELGGPHEQWLRDALYGSGAAWKLVFAHHILGCEKISSGGQGTFYYGFGSGARTHGRVHQLLRNARITGYLCGHNHKFCHVIKGGVNYVNAPSNMVAQGMGRHAELFNDSFGTSSSEGAELHDGEDATLIGVQKHYEIAGYLVFTVSAPACSFAVRQSCFCYKIGEGAILETRRLGTERFLGPIRTATVNVVDVEEAPRDVAYAVKDADLTGDWWDGPPTDYKGAAVGDYGFDEDYADGEVTLDPAISGDDVRVDNIPRTLAYNPTLANADPARGKTIEAEPEDNMIAPTYEMQVSVEGV